MTRILPAAVLAAYAATGARPERGTFYARRGPHEYCCGAGVVLLADGFTGDQTQFCNEAHRRFGPNYMVGYWRGFDEHALTYEPNTAPEFVEQVQLGYADGRACAAAVFGEVK